MQASPFDPLCSPNPSAPLTHEHACPPPPLSPGICGAREQQPPLCASSDRNGPFVGSTRSQLMASPPVRGEGGRSQLMSSIGGASARRARSVWERIRSVQKGVSRVGQGNTIGRETAGSFGQGRVGLVGWLHTCVGRAGLGDKKRMQYLVGNAHVMPRCSQGGPPKDRERNVSPSHSPAAAAGRPMASRRVTTRPGAGIAAAAGPPVPPPPPPPDEEDDKPEDSSGAAAGKPAVPAVPPAVPPPPP